MIRSALAMAAVTLGVAAPLASAHPAQRASGPADPVASALCSRVAAGNLPTRITADATQIAAACSTLTTSSRQTVTAYQTAIAPIAGDVKATLATVRAARQTAEQTHDWTSYRAVVAQARVTLKGLRGDVRAARRTEVTAVRTARHTFWTTVHALPGAGSLPTDPGTPAVPAGPVVPAGS